MWNKTQRAWNAYADRTTAMAGLGARRRPPWSHRVKRPDVDAELKRMRLDAMTLAQRRRGGPLG